MAAPAPRSREDLPRVRALALEDLLGAVAAEAPVVLLVDDLHWADAESRRILSGFAERLAAWPVLLVMASRPIRGEVTLPGAEMIQLEPVYKIDVSGLPSKGPEHAPVTITVFSDYQ